MASMTSCAMPSKRIIFKKVQKWGRWSCEGVDGRVYGTRTMYLMRELDDGEVAGTVRGDIEWGLSSPFK